MQVTTEPAQNHADSTDEGISDPGTMVQLSTTQFIDFAAVFDLGNREHLSI